MIHAPSPSSRSASPSPPTPSSLRPASLRAALVLLALITLGPLAASGCVGLTPYPAVARDLPTGSLVTVDGQRVHVLQQGPPDGEPVVLLHGFGASAWSWRQVMPALAERHRTLAFDLNGFGFTERPRDPAAYTSRGQIELVLGVLDALGIERAHLVGHSYGGALGHRLAVEHPERLRSLALVASAEPGYPQTRRSHWAAVRPLDALFLRTVGLTEGAVRRGLQRSVANDALVTPELVREYHRRLAVEGAPRAYWGLTRPVAGPPPVDLAEISVPTLVVWGEEDAVIPVAAARQRVAQIPDARVEVLPGVGHLPMEEAPTELARLLLAFFAAP